MSKYNTYSNVIDNTVESLNDAMIICNNLLTVPILCYSSIKRKKKS